MKSYNFLIFAAAAVSAIATLNIEFVNAQKAPVTTPGRITLNNCPNGVRFRREIRTLSDNERQSFINALRQLQKGAGPTRFDDYAKLHSDNAPNAHSSAIFLPWHRRMLRELEIDLQEIDPNIMLPYWEWCVDSQAPEKSIVFTNEYFGGNGHGSNGCVSDGPFADWKPYYVPEHCLSRKFIFGTKMGTLYSPEAIQYSINRGTEFITFSHDIESTSHATVHNGIGGGMWYMYSPSDPLFYLHHAMVDRIWWQWQKSRPGNQNAFNGKLRDGTIATPDTKIAPWNDLVVKDMFSTEALCYNYSDLPVSQVEKQPPSATQQPADTPAPSTDVPSAGQQSSQQVPQQPQEQPQNHNVRRSHDEEENCEEDDTVDTGYGTNPEPVNTPTNNVPITPDSNDRDSLTKIRLPSPVPDAWLAMNFIPINATRQREAEYKNKVYDKLNSIHGYVSPCALINRGDIVSKLIAAGKKTFTVGFGTERVPITLDKLTSSGDIKEALKGIRQSVVEYINKSPFSIINNVLNPESIIKKVTSIIGSPSQAGLSPNSASNFILSASRDFTKGWTPILQSLGNDTEEEDCDEEEEQNDIDEDCDEEDQNNIDEDCEEDDENNGTGTVPLAAQ
jgi:hypothetical protein